MIKKVFFAFSVCLASSAFAGWFSKPVDYDECILQSMKDVQSDKAASLIQKSCMRKFPAPTTRSKSIDLPRSVMEKLEGRGGVNGNTFQAKIINNNTMWRIALLDIRVCEKNDKNCRDYTAKPMLRIYEGGDALNPLTTGVFQFTSYHLPKEWTWYIMGGKGFKVS